MNQKGFVMLSLLLILLAVSLILIAQQQSLSRQDYLFRNQALALERQQRINTIAQQLREQGVNVSCLRPLHSSAWYQNAAWETTACTLSVEQSFADFEWSLISQNNQGDFYLLAVHWKQKTSLFFIAKVRANTASKGADDVNIRV